MATQTEEEFLIPIDAPAADFKNHLEIEGNKRILFSGPFGSGKTWFLKEFFEQRDEGKKYEAIHISPVNYSVASNEDIFELIKVDVLIHLLSLDLDFEKIEFNLLETSWVFLNMAPTEFIEQLIPFAQNGGLISKVWDGLKKLGGKLSEFHSGAQKDEKRDVIKYIASLKSKPGSIIEEDFITLLIKSLLQQLRGEDTEKREVVLIVDDLDRVDPEHIFRLLNVFSAHWDPREEEKMKLGFDKVVMVCDEENVKKIFHARYGQGVDYTGYMGKFFSQHSFIFDNVQMLIPHVRDVLVDTKLEGSNFYLSGSSRLFNAFADVIAILIVKKVINIRHVSRMRLSEFYTTREKWGPVTFSGRERLINGYQVPAIVFFEYLAWISAGWENLKQRIENMDQLPVTGNIHNWSEIVYLLITPILVMEDWFRDLETSYFSTGIFLGTETFEFKGTLHLFDYDVVGVTRVDWDEMKGMSLEKLTRSYFKDFLLKSFEIVQGWRRSKN